MEAIHGRLEYAGSPAFIEVRGKREGEELGFRRFYPSVAALVEDMKSWPPDQNYWVGVAPRRSNRGGKKEDCLALTACFGDVDVGNAGHKVTAKYKDKASALAVIERFPLQPSILVDSGAAAIKLLKEGALLMLTLTIGTPESYLPRAMYEELRARLTFPHPKYLENEGLG